MAAGSPRWWLEKLNAQLTHRQPVMELMDSYYYGSHPLPFLTRAHDAKMRKEFRQLLEDSRSNFMRLVVDAVEERLQVEGFRLSSSNDQAADQESWAIWQANEMDAESQTAFVEALVKGVSYLSVWGPDEGDNYPHICVEDPLQTIVGYVPGSNYRTRAAALKVWRDDWTGNDRANVYLPDGIYKFERADIAAGDRSAPSPWNSVPAGDDAWTYLEDEFVPNPIGVVPIVPVRNRPRLLLEGESELSDVYRVQNQINGFLFLLALAGYYGAHRQRWATGINIWEADQSGRPKEKFDVAVDKLWFSEDPNVKFGEFSQTDLGGYRAAIDQKVQHIAFTTRTPQHYLEQTGQMPSGDAIKSAESGLVKKVERKHRPFGEALEEALRLARRFQGQESPVDSEIIWADPNVKTEAEVTDSTIKRFQLGLITLQQAQEDLGYSQVQIERMAAERAAEPPVSPNPLPGPNPLTPA